MEARAVRHPRRAAVRGDGHAGGEQPLSEEEFIEIMRRTALSLMRCEEAYNEYVAAEGERNTAYCLYANKHGLARARDLVDKAEEGL